MFPERVPELDFPGLGCIICPSLKQPIASGMAFDRPGTGHTAISGRLGVQPYPKAHGLRMRGKVSLPKDKV